MDARMDVELIKQDDWGTEHRRFKQRVGRDSSKPHREPDQELAPKRSDVPFELSGRLLQASATWEQLSTRTERILEALGPLAGNPKGPGTALWLILVDLFLGQSARYLILRFEPYITAHAPVQFDTYCIQIVDRSLRWLNDWPVGLKLNTPLSEFYCSALGSIVRGWGALLGPHVARNAGLFVGFVASLSSLGVSFALSANLDLLMMLTLHLRLCWIVTRRVCLWQLDSLSGLWNLFRGKRWNVLRKRTDSYAYDVDQLFLGTLFFTVSIFLFPTVLVYASLFGLIHGLVLATCWVLRLPIAALNGSQLK